MNALMAYLVVRAISIRELLEHRTRAAGGRLGSERGQGTVEYVGLILLVSLLMVGMVAAMKGFKGTLPRLGEKGQARSDHGLYENWASF